MGFIKTVGGSIVSALASDRGSLGSIVSIATETALAAAAPDQYEAYQLTLQVVSDTAGSLAPVIDSMAFPVMPESMAIVQKYLMTVTPTLGGNFIDDFGRAPSPIFLSGTFGKKVRPIIGSAGNLRSLGGLGTMLSNSGVATGYGMVKHLSALVEKSHTADNGKLPRTVLYNWAFNSHWEVVIDSFQVQMDVRQNGIWMYQMQLRTIRPYSDSLAAVDRLLDGAIQGIAGKALNDRVLAVLAGVKIARSIGTAAVKTGAKSAISSITNVLSRT